jgi:FtsZ-interacting cell division protein ZipA
MSAGAIIAIVIGALIVIAIVAWLSRRARNRRLETRRVDARRHREDASIATAQAEKTQAEADERAARARREAAKAEEAAVTARQQQRFARERHAHADSLDPDVDDDGSRRGDAEDSQVSQTRSEETRTETRGF